MRYLILFTVVFVTLCSCQKNVDYYVDEYIVTSSIRTRFACTKVYSQITNLRDESKELCFTIELSEDAFVSNLCMEVDGVKYRGIVEEKERARDEYDQAVKSKITVALVEAVEGVSQLFKVCTAVRGLSSASFTVEYKQRLILLQGSVEHRIPIEFGQNADNMTITATYDEPEGIRLIQPSHGYAHISNSGTGSLSYSRNQSSDRISEKEIIVKYEPVIRSSVSTYVANFTFIQLFTPNSDNCLNVNIVFVVDVSGSMRGSTKIELVKQFMTDAISTLDPENYFNIILFNSRVTKFRESLVTVDSSWFEALTFIDDIVAAGGTNMNDPLVTAAQHIATAFQEDPNRANLLFLISDGRANSGVTNADDIHTNFRNAQGNAPIALNTFSVGSNANNRLLSKLTIYNTGRLHYISDATVRDVGLNDELTRIFDDYRCPILSNVNFNYPDGSVDQLTITSFPYFFQGQEIAVSGRILSGEDDYIRMTITGVTGSGNTVTWRRYISMRLASQSEEECLVDKMSAYMRVKQNYTDYLYNPTEELRNEIIEQSKQNHFVTNLTSLLVSEQIGQTCTCPDECICNTQCPISGVQQPANNVAGNNVNLPTTGASVVTNSLILPNTINNTTSNNNNRRRRVANIRQRYLTVPKDRDCSTQVLDDFTVWQNMSQCRGSDNSVNNRIIQVRCRTDRIDTCRDYWIRSVDCDTGEVKYMSNEETGVKEDNRCIIWYDTGDNSLRCSTQHNMLQNLVELEVSFCPISEEENRDHQEEMELLYDEFDPVCDYSDELADCKLA